jgi:hypothetical protein
MHRRAAPENLLVEKKPAHRRLYKPPVEWTPPIDTNTPTGRAMWQMIGVLAELERSLIGERTRDGVKAAQRRGVNFGRKPKLTLQQINHAASTKNRKLSMPQWRCDSLF